MIKPSEIINALESDSKILTYKIEDGLPFWYIVRYDVFLSILNTNNNLKIANVPGKLKPSILKTLFFSVSKSPIFIKKRQAIFFNSGVTNVKDTNDDKYFNRVTDSFFFQLKPDALLIEDTAAGELRWPRVHNKVYPHLSLILLSKIFSFFGKALGNLNKQAVALTDHIVSKLNQHNLSFNKAELIEIINRNVLNYYKKKTFYKWFIKWKRPRLIFLEDASYGSRLFILLTAKNLNIPVVELQHGFINEEHFAYRLGAGIEKHPLSKLCYPDYFFAYGKFWADEINIPSKTLIIGNPYLEKQLAISNSLQPEKIKTILFLSSAVAFAEAIEFLLKLEPLATQQGYKILFRPHPLEIDSLESRYHELVKAGIEFSLNSTLYVDFSIAEIIIGELSTALFESMALKEKKQFLLMTSYTYSYYNHKIKIPQIFIDDFTSIFETQTIEQDKDYFWAQNWEDKFKLALTEVLG
ncbi:hypothetical protein [Pedobacter sp. MW01-1-1]|uniref:hypothetical protein n=1 Tax=Pedobacter sp. MW01-1-1 TaxID=3383027 RepID=UPI003FEFA438